MSSPSRALALLVALPLILAAPQASAQNSTPPPTPVVINVPAPQDVAYPGTIQLEVDATDIARAIFKVRETIPVARAGRMTLLFPEWLPGHHGPDGQIDKVAGLEFFAGGQKIAWERDPVDVYAYYIDVPAGATSVEARFQFLSATQPSQGRVVVTPDMLNLQFGSASLYPAGYDVRRIPVVASVILPAGWQAGTALRPIATPSGSGANRITYGEVSYETLQDSPMFAGRHFRRDELGHGVTLVSVADEAKELAIPADVIAKHRAMVDQTVKLFGAKHYDHYDILNAVTDKLGGIGLEHHRSTEITTDPGYYTDYANHLLDRNVFPHEYVHSWVGKYRRPAGQIVADFRAPLRNSLMWVYEGQDQFWGYMIEARSGMSSKEDVLQRIAVAAAGLDNQPGRQWRPLVDTTYDPIIQNRAPAPWGSFQRNEDYYNEGMLIWIEADAIIREGTGGKRGMDEFARAFFGGREGDWGVVPFTRDDVIRTLTAVHPYDWTGFLHSRVDLTSERAPLGGLARSGYELRYTDEPTDAYKALIKASEGANFVYSLGFNVTKDKKLTGILWGSPAFEAALRVGDEIVAVGDKAYSGEVLDAAVTAAKSGTQPVRLTIKRGDAVRVVDIRYNGGLRYPRLVKTGKGMGPLDKLLKPR